MFRSTVGGWTAHETMAERSSIIQRADMDRRMVLHLQRLGTMQSTIDTSAPSSMASGGGARRNVKQELLQQERHEEIMRNHVFDVTDFNHSNIFGVRDCVRPTLSDAVIDERRHMLAIPL